MIEYDNLRQPALFYFNKFAIFVLWNLTFPFVYVKSQMLLNRMNKLNMIIDKIKLMNV